MIKRFLYLFIVFFVLSDAYSNKNKAVEKYLHSLPVYQQLSQMFLVNIQGDSVYFPVEYTEEGSPVVPGGCLFFNYNIAKDAESVISFTSSISDYCNKYNIDRPYIAVDQEGGYVNRLRNLTIPLPSSLDIADNYTAKQAYNIYLLQARQMNALGFDMNLAPVAEVLTEENKAFLENRSYGDKVKTSVYSVACINAYRDGGINCVVKHFPGNTNVDPHSGLPEIMLSQKNVWNDLLLPFFFVTSASPAGVLMSHAKLKNFEDSTPACLSKFWCSEILRDTFGYTGLIISDDIFMAALQKNGYSPEKAAIMAVNAGVDVLMLSEKKFMNVLHVIAEECKRNEAFAQKVLEAEKKVILYKIDAGILSLEKNVDGSYSVVPVALEKQLGTKDERIKRFENAKRLYKEMF